MELSKAPTLIKVGQIITSKRTGKNLKCYNIMGCYIGRENNFKNWVYSFWDEEKKKTKSMPHIILQKMLNNAWQIK